MLQAKQADFPYMNMTGWFNAHRYSAYVIGTLLIQGVTFGAAIYLAQETPPFNTQPFTSQQVDSPQANQAANQLPNQAKAIASNLDRPDNTASLNLPNSTTLGSTNSERVTAEAGALQGATDSETATSELPSIESPIENVSNNKIIDYKLNSGETLATIWKKHGASYAGCLKAAKAFEQAGVSLSALRAGDNIELEISEEPTDIVGLRYRMRGGKTLVITGSAKDGYSATINRSKVTESERSATGKIDSSFSVAALNLGVPYPVIDDLVDLFSSRVEFRRDFKPGDEFTLIFSEERLSDGEVVSVGPIKAALLKVDGRVLVAVRHIGQDGIARYFDEKGQSLESGFLRYPLAFTRISSVFSDARLHPVTKVRKPHNGVDFAARTGTPVRSVGDGRVVFAGYNGGAGYMVKIQHNSKWATAYMHLSKIDSKVRKGAFVTRSQVIGSVGATGMATGPHLHYSLYQNGRYVDPIKTPLPTLDLDRQNMISKGYLQTALNTLKHLHSKTFTQLALQVEEDKNS